MGIRKDERGVSQIVEATILLPAVIIMVFAMYYAALFMAVQANLQINLQNALLYYKNQESDTFVGVRDDLGSRDGVFTASRIDIPHDAPDYPYRFIVMKFRSGGEEGYKTLFRTFFRYLFFEDSDLVEVVPKYHNYLIYKEISAVARVHVKPAIEFTMVGVKGDMVINASAKAVITDGDDFIRNTDMVMDFVENTALGDKLEEALDKVAGLYKQFKDALGI